jgi:tetratricopeptide (TPR) repeat protein
MRSEDAARLALTLGKEKNITRSHIAEWKPLLDYCAGNPLTLRVLIGQAITMRLHGRSQIERFVEEIRSGEQRIEDSDEKQGRDKSLGASLDYGFRGAFKDHELPIIALLHLFQNTVDVDALELMSKRSDNLLPELIGATKATLANLLERASAIGLLNHVDATWFTIHPALPWFLRQLFINHYDGNEGRSTAFAAVKAWVEAMSRLAGYYHYEFNEGNRGAINVLELEEANLLQARSLSLKNDWSHQLVSCMQGLDVLFDYQGRLSEWAKLVEEIRPVYATSDDQPIAGRENEYSVVMNYVVRLARVYERDFVKAAELQKKLVALVRQQAASALAVPDGVELKWDQQNQLRTLSVNNVLLGQILLEEEDVECVPLFQEAIRLFQRISDKAAEAIAQFNLGHAYLKISSIRDLDAAETAYQRSLDLRVSTDVLGRSKCIKHIGMVHHDRYMNAVEEGASPEMLEKYTTAAEGCYLEALRLRPSSATAEMGPMYGQLANLYSDMGKIEEARENYEKAAQFNEMTGNRYGAGVTRTNLAMLFFKEAVNHSGTSQERTNLLRSKAYAEAALQDFEYYQGHAAADEARTQHILDQLNSILGPLT